MRRYNKNFRFADEIVSGDAIISAILGIISIIATLITVIYVVSVKGMASSKVDTAKKSIPLSIKNLE